MTWQRIDENTYIDDTLVTCAEYQLFIDEMRVQGKYYQPDHWTSYQFPKGHAREPILGARPSDASTFCDWLTNHEASGWVYCLPTYSEALKLPLNEYYQRTVGYWINDATSGSNFILIHKMHDDVTTIDIDQLINIAHKRIKDSARRITFDSAFDRDHKLHGTHDRAISLEKNLVILHALENFSQRNLLLRQDIILEIDDSINDELSMGLYTLQERITGNSPAFEGIRLVKERMR